MLRQLLGGAAIAAALMVAAPASALTIKDLGNNPNSSTGAFSNSVLGTTFSDQYTFHLIGAQFVTFASATNDFLTAADFITNFTGQLFSSGANGLPGGGDDVAFNAPVSAVPCPTNPTGCQILAGSALLPGGNYFLSISGTGGGTAGYGGNLTTAAVPFPAAGAGLPGVFAGAMALLAWRRRQRVAHQ